MPPTGKLNASEIAILTEWVKMGAPWTTAKTSEAAKNASYIITPRAKVVLVVQANYKACRAEGKKCGVGENAD